MGAGACLQNKMALAHLLLIMMLMLPPKPGEGWPRRIPSGPAQVINIPAEQYPCLTKAAT